VVALSECKPAMDDQFKLLFINGSSYPLLVAMDKEQISQRVFLSAWPDMFSCCKEIHDPQKNIGVI